MFTIHCPREGVTVLLGARRIHHLEHVDGAVVVYWTCTCGATGTTVTGRRARPALAPAAARSAA